MAANPGTTNLIAWWQLNETSGNRIDSQGGNTLTDNNTVLYGTGKRGNCASFVNANNEYLSIVDNAALSFADEDFALGCWVYLDNKTTTQALISKWDGGNNKREYILNYDKDVDRFVISISNNGVASQTEAADVLGSPSVTTWYFVVAWHDSVNNTINIQVNNGVVDSAAYANGCNDNTSDFMLGGLSSGGGMTSLLDGDIDEAFVYGAVLSSAEREWLYNSGVGRAYTELILIPRGCWW